MRSNAVAWNPQEPMNLVCANEDTNLYTFDMRNLKQVLCRSLCVGFPDNMCRLSEWSPHGSGSRAMHRITMVYY